MKKRIIGLAAVYFLFSGYAFGQDETVNGMKTDAFKTIKKNDKDTIPKIWKTGGLFTLNLNQGSLDNWSAGGDKFSFSLNAYSNLYAFYKKGKHSWDNSLDLAYGLMSTTTLGTRKVSDRIDLLSKYDYSFSKKWDVGLLFNGRTQFAEGKNYEKTAAGLDTSYVISNFFSPANLILSLGVDYKPNPDLSVFLSPITARWVIVTDKSLGFRYKIDSGKTVRNELGAFLTANYKKKFAKTFTYIGRLDLFSNYRHDPQNIDVFWTNILSARITKYINFSFTLEMIYDDDTKNINPAKGPAPQWLQLMGIGLSYSIANRKL